MRIWLWRVWRTTRPDKITGLAALWLALSLALSGCGTASYQSVITTPPPVYETPGPLDNTAYFWDMGMQIKYPANWVAPQFLSGQMTLAGSLNVAQGRDPRAPLVAFRLVNNVELHLTKDATLQEIAAAVSAGADVTIDTRKEATFAGLDAALISLTDHKNNLYGSALTFRLPDGRVGSFIALAPQEEWPDFLTVLSSMTATVTLAKPPDFAQPRMSSSTATFPPGGISFAVPQGWTPHTEQGIALVQHSDAETEYLDNSGYINGPQLVVVARPLAANTSLHDALTKMITITANDKLSDIMVGPQPAVQVVSSDPTTGQLIIFIGVASDDKTALIVFRWTTPGMLSEVSQPTLDAILRSVSFGPIPTPIILTLPPPTMTPTQP